MFPDDADVRLVHEAMFDPFEYLVARHRDGLLKTDFKRAARQGQLPRALPRPGAEDRPQDRGDVRSSSARHRVAETGRALLGPRRHLRREDATHPPAMKIGKPVFKAMAEGEPDFISSDCALAGHHIAAGHGRGRRAQAPLRHPLSLVRMAYGLGLTVRAMDHSRATAC